MEKRTLLYVDDEEINLLVFKVNFDKKFNVITADSGFEGLKILDKHPEIEIIISDMKMPQMNGLEFIREVKEKFRDIICFILTGYDITDEISFALKDKLINDYFKKPFNGIEIENSIIKALG